MRMPGRSCRRDENGERRVAKMRRRQPVSCPEDRRGRSESCAEQERPRESGTLPSFPSVTAIRACSSCSNRAWRAEGCPRTDSPTGRTRRCSPTVSTPSSSRETVPGIVKNMRLRTGQRRSRRAVRQTTHWLHASFPRRDRRRRRRCRARARALVCM